VILADASRLARSGEVDAKQVGIALFGPYLLAVELASHVAAGALVAAYHLGTSRDDKAKPARSSDKSEVLQ
jgi:NADH-quinone oxidoreductase subunit J